jgi:hypothetical protein
MSVQKRECERITIFLPMGQNGPMYRQSTNILNIVHPMAGPMQAAAVRRDQYIVVENIPQIQNNHPTTTPQSSLLLCPLLFPVMGERTIPRK